jgi:hypothetical protein
MEQPIEPNQQPGQPQTPPSQIQPSQPSPRNKILLTGGIIIVALLLIAGGAFGYWQYQQMQASKPSISQNNQVAVTGNPNGNHLQPGDNNYPTSTPVVTPPIGIPSTGSSGGSGLCKNPGPVLASRSGMIQWQNGQNIDGLKIFAQGSANDGAYQDDSSRVIGHFVSGEYQGADLIVTELQPNYQEPGGDLPNFYRIVRIKNSYVMLGKYSDQLPDSSEIKVIVNLSEDKNFILPDLDMPDTLHSTNPLADFSLVGSLGAFTGSWKDFCADNLIKAFTDPVLGDVYTNQPDTIHNPSGPDTYFMHGFYLKSPDGSQVTYQLTLPFVTNNGHTPLVTWNNNLKNSEDYSYQAVGGCGASQFLDVENVNNSDLTQIGTTLNGQAVYGYKNSNADELTAMYGEIYVPDGQTKPSYADFVAENPIFFWQDPFGQFVRFKIMKYQPLAECAKPVIYLYPRETEKISVQIDPAGGMLKSDPAYNYGWNVISDPLSNITNLADGQSYPYLFWEGRGGMYKTPDKGFVVAQADVHEFLTDKLRQLGLNDNESADFILFWEPKMHSSPYYFVTFMGNSVMDQLAPLSVVPKPDTIIRILMDFTPLDHPVKVQSYNIRTPERKGFTGVEWGGVLRNGHN